jgi:hypothetical protein
MLTKLDPIPHFKLTDYVRVAIHHKRGEYTVYLDNDMVRQYTLQTLPPYISSKITVAKALSLHVRPDYEVKEHDIFMCDVEQGDPDVAWRASENWYIGLKKNGNPRKESKRKSKKNIKKD